MKDTGVVLLGSIGAVLGILGLVYALHELMVPMSPENLPLVAGGLLVYTAGWVVSLWAFPR